MRSRYARGAVERSRYARGAVKVRSWCGRAVEVRSWYSLSTVEVRSWCASGSVHFVNFSTGDTVGTCVFTATQKTILYIIIVSFAENASFRSYGVICLL